MKVKSQQKKIPGLALLSLLAAILAWIVIGLGGYTRLTDAGLGCPDWPGCYGHLIVSHVQPLIQHKAWTEMLHRYCAGTLAALVVGVTVLSALSAVRRGTSFIVLALLLFILVIYQAVLGMWTVTLKLWPLIVSQHLLGGMTLLALLWLVHLKSRNNFPAQQNHLNLFWPRTLVLIGLVFLYLQISLGAWTSTNYAALSCLGFPTCGGIHGWRMDFTHAFNLLSPIGINYSGGVLSDAARQTIQMTHRIGALVVSSYLIFLVWYLLTQTAEFIALRRAVCFMLLALFLQIALGISNILFQLPLAVAVLHNMVAALLLCSVVTVHYLVWHRNSVHA